MEILEQPAPGSLLRAEPYAATLLCVLAFCAVPFAMGGLGISWDALNHHIYLGWSAESPRFDRDYLGAAHQAYQWPYLYWPAYKLAMGGFSGVAAGMVLATLHATGAPAAWLISRACVPGDSWAESIVRLAAVALAFMSPVALSLLDSTSNDWLAGIPLLWAIAVMLSSIGRAEPDCAAAVRWSGALAGLAVACKLSNAPVAIVLPLLWAWRGSLSRRVQLMAQGGAIAALVFLALYGPWGFVLWREFGNPVYPLYDHWFEGLRQLAGWKP
jgi:hypothetical protein